MTTYKEAGVDIENTDALVEDISELSKSTNRNGNFDKIGGFGGIFDLKNCGYEDPLLVSGTDGIGTKILLGIETDILDGLGHDLVGMCLNDILCHGAEPLFFLDYFDASKIDKNSLFITCIICSFIYAESIWVNYGWEIFDNAGDGRALSLGNSLIADGSSPISVLWNPAHQDAQRILPFSYGHQSRFAGLVSSDVLVFSYNKKIKTPLSIVILREAVSNIPDTRDLLLDWGEDGMPGTMDFGEANGGLDEGERLDFEKIKYFNHWCRLWNWSTISNRFCSKRGKFNTIV